jgi:hypothetical protein
MLGGFAIQSKLAGIGRSEAIIRTLHFNVKVIGAFLNVCDRLAPLFAKLPL